MTRITTPLLVYDGDCSFCRAWIARWQRVIGDRIAYAPYQEAAALLPDLPRERPPHAVILVEPDGRRSQAAEAVFRSLAYAPGCGWALWLYRFVPGVAPASDACYRWIAGHRPVCDRLTGAIWGPHLVPPGERLTAWVFLRLLGIVFMVAFVSAWVQIIGLVGAGGILPVRELLPAVPAHYGLARYWVLPTLAWVNAGDGALVGQCAAGVACSLLLALGVVPAASLVTCWALYLSLATVGQDFFWFQWDGLLLETGFLALFLAPLRWRSVPGRDPEPSRLALWALRALLFRLMFSSAAVKLTSGDPTWRDLTALEYHYETQCIPPWTAWFAHHMPAWWQRASAVMMFVIEGLMPWLIVAPRRIRFAAATAMASLQLVIAATGNYGFFNLLSCALCVLLLDDGVWPWRWRSARRAVAAAPLAGGRPSAAADADPGAPGRWPAWVLRPVLVTLLVLSLVPLIGALRWPTAWLGPVPGVYGLISPFRTVNRYGLFSVMTTRRPEIVIEGSRDGLTWQEYTFRWKAGAVRRRPAFVAPHMPRLDWQMWFAALGDYRNERWFLAFCQRLLESSPPVLALLANDPFPGAPPRYLRALAYDYHFTDAATRRATGAWWRRDLRGLYCPVLTLESGRLQAVSPGVAGR